MNLYEQENTAGSPERQRQLTPEMAAASRASFFKSLAPLAVSLLVAVVGFSMSHDRSNTWACRNEILLASVTLVCVLFASVIAYVHFLDWQRCVARERKLPRAHADNLVDILG